VIVWTNDLIKTVASKRELQIRSIGCEDKTDPLHPKGDDDCLVSDFSCGCCGDKCWWRGQTSMLIAASLVALFSMCFALRFQAQLSDCKSAMLNSKE